MRTLRQMRDLRRYAPAVTIAHAQQVNIAADGGRQINQNGQRKGDDPADPDPAGRAGAVGPKNDS